MAGMRVISADSHMMEPADLWEIRLDHKFSDRAPKVVKNERGKGFMFVAPGVRPFPVAGGFGIGKSGEELKEHLQKGYEAARPSGWDPAERLRIRTSTACRLKRSAAIGARSSAASRKRRDC